MRKYKVNYFYVGSALATGIAEAVVEALNDGEYPNMDVAIFEEVDRAMIYYSAQWELLMQYCTPETADIREATLALFDDLYECIELVEEEEQ